MGINIEKAQGYLSKLSKHLERKQKSVRFVFLSHTNDLSHEALIDAVSNHQNHDVLEKITINSKRIKQTKCFGVAKIQEKSFLNLGKNDSNIALVVVNLKDISDKHDLVFMAYRGVAEAIKMIEERDSSDDITLPKPRDTRERVMHNLITDIYAGLSMMASGHENGFKHIAKKRAEMSLVPMTGYLPEDYPFAIAHEMLMQKYSDAPKHEDAPHKFVQILNTAKEYAALIDGSRIQKWRNFVTPAQNMLWRGYSKEEALTSAVNFSEDANSTNIGMMVSDLLEFKTVASADMPDFYNGFSSDERNTRQHQKKIDEIFEHVIAKSHEEQSAESLYEKANELNIRLSNGRIMGWCASALQAAAKAFDKALHDKETKHDASNLARTTFEESQQGTNWDSLRKFGELVIRKNRLGHKTGLNEIKELAEGNSEFKTFADSVAATIKDPIFIKSLEVANDTKIDPALAGPKVTRQFEFSQKPNLGNEIRPDHAPPVEMTLGLGSGGSAPRKFKDNRALSVVESEKSQEDNKNGDTAKQ